MIGMDFYAFVVISVISLIVGAFFFYAVRYRLGPEFEGFLVKLPLAWFGAWVGSPVVGHWGPAISGVYVIPAIIGALAAVFLATRFFKTVNLVDAHDLLERRERQRLAVQQRVQSEAQRERR